MQNSTYHGDMLSLPYPRARIWILLRSGHRAERKEVTKMSDSNGASVQSVVVPRPGLFKVCRTSASTFDATVAPCKGASVFQFLMVERRAVSDPSKVFKCESNDWWYGRGSNHRVENGSVCRDMGYSQDWFIELNDIMAFVREVGGCVVFVDSFGFDCIEIYDYYRE